MPNVYENSWALCLIAFPNSSLTDEPHRSLAQISAAHFILGLCWNNGLYLKVKSEGIMVFCVSTREKAAALPCTEWMVCYFLLNQILIWTGSLWILQVLLQAKLFTTTTRKSNTFLLDIPNDKWTWKAGYATVYFCCCSGQKCSKRKKTNTPETIDRQKGNCTT